LRNISSKDVPVGAPEGLKRHSHSEQPNPRKRSSSIDTSFRLAAVIETKPFCSAINCSFSDAFGPMATEKPSPVRTRRKTHKGCSLHVPILTGLSGILHTRFLLGRSPRLGWGALQCLALPTPSAFCATCLLLERALSLRLSLQIRGNFVSGDARWPRILERQTGGPSQNRLAKKWIRRS
jgi:hypothetical protein